MAVAAPRLAALGGGKRVASDSVGGYRSIGRESGRSSVGIEYLNELLPIAGWADVAISAFSAKKERFEGIGHLFTTCVVLFKK